MPFPSPLLLPSPFLFPGISNPFADLIIEATSPWADKDGAWAAYNAALAEMYELTFDIVADQGDVSQTQVATLSSQLSTAAPITSIPVGTLSVSIKTGVEITLSFATFSQVFVPTADANAGDGVIFVEPQTPNFEYPIGTPVQLAYIPGWSSLLDPNRCPDQFLPFLAQFNGTDVPVGLDAVTARTKILEEGAQKRGTYGAIVSAIQRNLDPNSSQDIFIEERIDAIGNVNAYWFVVIVRPSQVLDTQVLIDSVNAVKPGGIQWTLIQTDQWIISQMEASSGSIGGIEGNFVSITGLEQDIPGT